jgi:hypothetical protein
LMQYNDTNQNRIVVLMVKADHNDQVK